ncbi:forkhead-associated domain-containing protein [Phanerochaete sordida]|uniref:Forkhead-associated domain-containing protein n=1 Tax=Phanerochaete sordida TaxID=48140 RepID=A0A9P3G8M3_9APHY|nr:forkhead-associated domain-containing protein [Phanerochaete sordida]
MENHTKSFASCMKSLMPRSHAQDATLRQAKAGDTRPHVPSPLRALASTKEEATPAADAVDAVESRHDAFCTRLEPHDGSDDESEPESDSDEGTLVNMQGKENISDDTLFDQTALKQRSQPTVVPNGTDTTAVAKKKKIVDVEGLRRVSLGDTSAPNVSVPEDPAGFLKPTSKLRRNGTLCIPSHEVLTVGRDESNDLVVDDPFVADKHAVLDAQLNGQVVLQAWEDELMEVPTYINGEKVEPEQSVVLQPRDRVVLGKRGHGREYEYVMPDEYLQRGRRADALREASREHSRSHSRECTCHSATGDAQYQPARRPRADSGRSN